MKKFLCSLVLVILFCDSSFAASSSELKRMSVFISNFVEAGLNNFDVNDISDSELIRFGVWHNYINNFKSRIRRCPTKNCPHGSLIIDSKYVDESVKKYFDMEIRKHKTIGEGYSTMYYDGKRYYHFDGADGESIQAEVFEASTRRDGVIVMKGATYHADHEDLGFENRFTATARPYKYNGKDTWRIISLEFEED